MFDPFDQVRMRTQRLLDSADHIRQERALGRAAREAAMTGTEAVRQTTATTPREPAEAARTAEASDPAWCETTPPDATRTRAA